MRTIDEEWRAFAAQMPAEMSGTEQVCFVTGYQVGFSAAIQCLAERVEERAGQVRALARSLGINSDALDAAVAQVRSRLKPAQH